MYITAVLQNLNNHFKIQNTHSVLQTETRLKNKSRQITSLQHNLEVSNYLFSIYNNVSHSKYVQFRNKFKYEYTWCI